VTIDLKDNTHEMPIDLIDLSELEAENSNLLRK